ncbi:hypothetical protein ACFVRD_41175 [Streptomyces sp. NPDC057908]|uniref:hypothetical protein n=1 Tax=Streptomyces sp. NPDC057908 TaxID=3346276 RepID=UPI0036EA4D77
MSDREQLLHLVTRARHGVALDTEHDMLVAGINAMADRVAEAEQEVTGMATAAAHLATLVGKRAEQAEAAIERVRAWADQDLSYPMYPELMHALDQPQQPTTTARHTGGNAEDCPVCRGTNRPYPFLCPAEQQPTA